MATEVVFFVEGTPKAQPRLRPRMGRDGRLAVHMPPSAEGWRLRVLMAARAALPAPLEGPLSVRLTFYMLRPSTARKRMYPEVKPDWDNLAKSTTDALNGIAWPDDCAVIDCMVQKRYAKPTDRVGALISIEVME